VKACVCQSVNGVRAEAARVVKLTGRLGRGCAGDLGTRGYSLEGRRRLKGKEYRLAYL
jgi:hypothetical protein